MESTRIVRIEDEHSLGDATSRRVVEYPADLSQSEIAVLFTVLANQHPSTLTVEE